MADVIQRIDFPELFFGIVAPIGTDMEPCISSLADKLNLFDYAVVQIKVTDAFRRLASYLPFNVDLKETPLEKRYGSYIEFGDKLRRHFSDDAILASIAIHQVVKARSRALKEDKLQTPERVAYIIRQFKRREEIRLLRTVYRELFFQISVYSQRSSRVDNLARKISSSHNYADPIRYRDEAERLVRVDETETDDVHGQRVGEIFHEGDFIVNTDLTDYPVEKQVGRFVDLVFGSNSISPNKYEYGMYLAKSASLRTIDLSRQVGAAIFTGDGEIIALGANEVPKGDGGTYWSDDTHDDRDYKRLKDSNQKRKREILSELIDVLSPGTTVDEVIKNDGIEKSQFMDALEYGRIIHAEMSAICDSARLGRSTKGAILYCTTFPCHMCAKHIVASGIKEVVFLEPYPKSLASELHGDSVIIEGQSRGGYSTFPGTVFRHFFGVPPRRYRDLFERKRRKDEDGNFQQWQDGCRKPIMEVRLVPTYLSLEPHILKAVLHAHLSKAEIPFEVLDEPNER